MLLREGKSGSKVSTRSRLKTILVGFGRIAQGAAADPVLSKKIPYCTHAQVLREHPLFDWQAVVDPSEEARSAALRGWHVEHVFADLDEVTNLDQYEVAVFATPPLDNWDILFRLPSLKGVLAEKPPGKSTAVARDLVAHCASRGIALQVNLMRRADESTQLLRNALLSELIGKMQAVTGFYTHGLLNNGIHMIDLARMLIKQEVVSVQADVGRVFHESPISDDINLPFKLTFDSGLSMTMNALKLSCFRENGMEFWGECGRLSYLHSGFSLLFQGLQESSLVSGERELSLTPRDLPVTLGQAFFRMYTNLANAIELEEELVSPGESALRTMEVIDAIRESARNNGRIILCGKAGASSERM